MGTKAFRAILNSPIAGLAPWIVMSLFTGPGQFEEAAAAAFGVSALVLFANWRLGNSVKLLEWFDVAYFLVMVGIGLFASRGVIEWMELWGGELSNIALVCFALGSILIRRPFTLEYAREQVDRDHWESPIFIRTNYIITWAWVAAFAVQAIVGLIGDAVQHTSNNFWTGWILQIGAIVFAVAFTEFWPDYGPNKEMQKLGLETDPPAPLIRLFDWIPVFVLITGAAGLVTDSTSTTVGVILIVIGAVGIGAIKRLGGATGSATTAPATTATTDVSKGSEPPTG